MEDIIVYNGELVDKNEQATPVPPAIEMMDNNIIGLIKWW